MDINPTTATESEQDKGIYNAHTLAVGNSYSKRLSEFQGAKCLVFDSGPIISLSTSNLLGTLEMLKQGFSGKFVLPESVKHELVDDPLKTKKFMFEALQVQRLISLGVLEVLEDSDVKSLTLELLHLANSSFSAKGRPIQIVHYAEMASIATAKLLDAPALVLDERITRELVEHPRHLVDLMDKRLHTAVHINDSSLALLQKYSLNLKIIRSVELVSIAFGKGLLDRYIAEGEERILPNVRKKLLESVLWGLKLNGCAISSREIEQLIELLNISKASLP